ncbi:UNVERIFIED_CONTAM: hypothetical protein Slati_2092700 [Sesamum latifolium]|uniref:Endonuclease/exonuclease/phosphatase domain-containing protein n=1 Tax=Sesamum latifolium TaxID=2727402 RepID=A0AAW2WUD7_9LAMI
MAQSPPVDSYKAKLTANTQHIYFPTWLQDWDHTPHTVSPPSSPPRLNPHPHLIFPPADLQRFHQPWQRALILSTLNLQRSIPNLSQHLARLWKTSSPIFVSDLGEGCYIIKVSSQEDYFMALAGAYSNNIQSFQMLRTMEQSRNPNSRDPTNYNSFIFTENATEDACMHGVHTVSAIHYIDSSSLGPTDTDLLMAHTFHEHFHHAMAHEGPSSSNSPPSGTSSPTRAPHFQPPPRSFSRRISPSIPPSLHSQSSDPIGPKQLPSSAIPHNPHLFVGPPFANNLIIEIEQERDGFAREREAQFKLYLHPLGREMPPSLLSTHFANGHVNPLDLNLHGPYVPTSSPTIPTMKILSWNCRGASRAEFVVAARDLLQRYQPDIFIVMDTRLHADRSRAIIQRLPFSASIVTSALGLAGGIWVLWHAGDLNIRQLEVTARTIHLEVDFPRITHPFLMTAVHNYPQAHLQNQIASRPSDALISQENNLQKQLAILLCQQNAYWQQRAKAHWVKFGDLNSSYFHAYASHSRRRNFIQGVKDSNNQWIHEPTLVAQSLKSFFEAINTGQNTGVNPLTQTDFFDEHLPSLTQTQQLCLIKPVSEDEIYQALIKIGPNKARVLTV